MKVKHLVYSIWAMVCLYGLYLVVFLPPYFVVLFTSNSVNSLFDVWNLISFVALGLTMIIGGLIFIGSNWDKKVL